MDSLIIRADSFVDIGIGHVMRCMALGQALQDENHNVIFLTKTKNANLLNRLRREKFEVIQLDENLSDNEDAVETVKFAIQHNVKWVITDGYKFTTEYQRTIKTNGFRLLCIDDIARCHYVSDIVLNQNLNAEKIFNYSCEPYTKLLLGINYVLLRREFRNLKGWKRVIRKECNKILVIMGGADAQNNSLKTLRAFELIKSKKLHIKLILGFSFLYESEIGIFAQKSKHNFEMLKNVENLSPIIQWCDLAITAAGSTVWELIALKTPMILGIVANNQELIAKELESRNIATNLGWFSNLDEIKLSEEIYELIKSFEKRKTQGNRCLELFDTSGAQRIVNIMLGNDSVNTKS